MTRAKKTLALALFIIALGLPWGLGARNSNPTLQDSPANLSPQELAELRRKKEVFDALPPHRQERIRELDKLVHQQDNSKQLLQVLGEYNRWLTTLEPADRSRILDAAAADRLVQIRQLATRQRQRAFGLTAETRLPEADYDKFDQWLNELIEKQRNSDSNNSLRTPRTQDRRGTRGILLSVLFDRNRLLTEADVDELSRRLSPAGAKILNSRESFDDKVRLIFAWAASMARSRIPPAELQRFLENDLSPAVRQYIERLGPEQGQQELIRRYLDFRRREPPN